MGAIFIRNYATFTRNQFVSHLVLICPKVVGIFEFDGIFLGIYFFKKNPGIRLGNYRNCSVKLSVSVIAVLLLLIFLIRETQNKCFVKRGVVVTIFISITKVNPYIPIPLHTKVNLYISLQHAKTERNSKLTNKVNYKIRLLDKCQL